MKNLLTNKTLLKGTYIRIKKDRNKAVYYNRKNNNMIILSPKRISDSAKDTWSWCGEFEPYLYHKLNNRKGVIAHIRLIEDYSSDLVLYYDIDPASLVGDSYAGIINRLSSQINPSIHGKYLEVKKGATNHINLEIAKPNNPYVSLIKLGRIINNGFELHYEEMIGIINSISSQLLWTPIEDFTKIFKITETHKEFFNNHFGINFGKSDLHDLLVAGKFDNTFLNIVGKNYRRALLEHEKHEDLD